MGGDASLDPERGGLFEDFDDRPQAKPPISFEIRPALIEDAEALGRLSARREGGDPAEHIAGFARALSEGETLILLAEQEDRILGFGKARSLVPDDEAPEGWYLTGVVVDPKYRRRGIGVRLTEERLRRLTAKADRAYYFANARNRVSIALHERFGFTEIARGDRFAGVAFEGGEGILFQVDLDQRDAQESPLA